MSNFSSEYLSKEIYKELEKELEFLIKEKRREVSERLEDAISLGDLSENAEFQEAKEAQFLNEKRIAEIEDLLSRAVVISDSAKTRSRVDVGCFVVLKKKLDEELCEYRLVGSGEADPVKKRVSNESPLGTALLGKKKGAIIKAVTPNGEIEYTIIKIT